MSTPNAKELKKRADKNANKKIAAVNKDPKAGSGSEPTSILHHKKKSKKK